MINLLENMNEKQREAILLTEGPVLAIAGAGSGKTSVLTRRIAYLIYEKNVHFENILAITFTNKAANEMKQRVYDLIGVSHPRMWISTFHSMCSRILREHIERIGYKKTFQILDDDDVTQLVKSIMKKLNYDTKMFNPKIVKNYVIKIKYDKSVIDSIESPFEEVVKTVSKRYNQQLFENNLLDFEDLIVLTIKLLKEHQDVREYYQEKFKYVLIDEFQDTNNVQYDLVSLLLGKNQNIFIVGDEDQSIYAFRGANIENIRKFKRDYPKHHLVLLEENYRSTNTILKAANQIIKNNRDRISKNLFSSKGAGEQITHFKGVTARDEVEFVATKIQELKRKGYDYNDFAVLYRANSSSRSFEEVFMQKQIPYRIFGNTSFFKRAEIKDFTAYLRLMINLDDAYSFIRAISSPKRGVGGVTLDKLADFAADNSLSLMEAIDRSSEILGKSASTNLKNFKEMILDFRTKLNEISFNSLVDYILSESGYIEALKNDEKGDVRYENLLEFKTILSENEVLYQDLSKEEVLVYLLEDISLKSEESQSEILDGVTLMTLHAAKGLEFRVVFIVTMEMGLFPLNRSMMDRKDFEEERRLMYVGVTRAKELLYLTNASVRQTYGETSHNEDSCFIREINANLIDVKGYSEYVNRSFQNTVIQRKKEVSRTKLDNLNQYQENDLNKGDKITHTKFGDGVVISVVNDNCVIAFAQPHGIKRLLKDHPAISKK
ncbi:MAG: UvrD-helicase domain-containing protein [Firmicutes bacterium]|nr:UvrD-helicase domain-containing protein [Bacillota bacterium]